MVKEDGPYGGDSLWWHGKRHEIPKGVIYRLISHMWGQESASHDELFDADPPVFNDDVAPHTIASKASEASKWLVKFGVPWRLSSSSVSRMVTKKYAD